MALKKKLITEIDRSILTELVGNAHVGVIGADDSLLVEADNSIYKIKLSGVNTSLLALNGSDGSLIQDRSFCITINKAALSKTVVIGGNKLLYEKFKKWVDESPAPVEVMKSNKAVRKYLDKTDFTKRVDGTASQSGNTDWLQMVEMENINIGYFESDTEIQVWFNMDANCPAGFRRWFKEEKLLFGRYRCHANGSGLDVTQGTTYGATNFSAASMLTSLTNTGLTGMLDWEYTVLGWIFTAYYGTVNCQSIFGGVQSGSESVARAYINGTTDTLTTPHGQVTAVVATVTTYPFRFMYIENFYALQWVLGLGAKTFGSKFFLTYDRALANTVAAQATGNVGYFEEICAIFTDLGSTYSKNVNLHAIMTEKGRSSSTGFCDAQWTNTTNGNVSYRGGSSGYGAAVGVFARTLNYSPSYASWPRSCFATLA